MGLRVKGLRFGVSVSVCRIRLASSFIVVGMETVWLHGC